jgi:acetolactate synthase small subunit
VTVDATPGAVPRVLEPFARRSLVPTRWHGALDDEGEMQIDIQVAGVGRADAERIAAALRALVGVRAVLTYDKTR